MSARHFLRAQALPWVCGGTNRATAYTNMSMSARFRASRILLQKYHVLVLRADYAQPPARRPA
eukprot:1158148-Pelagomonas_calceolata.AAC.7